jgi:SAM-dependent methyltransferase
VVSFPDHFSSVAQGYARYRPSYPADLFDWIAAIAPARDAAWDCGAGSGQASLPLADRFAHVYATDASATQLAEAPAHDRISWREAPAEASGIDSRAVDAVTVAQALHWFALDRFWAEVRRVARPDAVFVAWSYGILEFDDGRLNRMLLELHDNIVGPYWPIERGRVDARYQGIDLPFERIPPPPIRMEANWTLDRLAGYLRTWSATRRYIVARGTDPVTAFTEALRDIWGDTPRLVRWPLTILAGSIDAR